MAAPLIHHQNALHLRDIHAAVARDRLGDRRAPTGAVAPQHVERRMAEVARRLFVRPRGLSAASRRLVSAR